MTVPSSRADVAGPAGRIETAIDTPVGDVRGVAVLCHPHPLHGGTMDNKVVQTLARAFVQLGWRAVRFNFRGVGASQGQWDQGCGEVDDALAVVAAQRDPPLPLALGGFSFGRPHSTGRARKACRWWCCPGSATSFTASSRACVNWYCAASAVERGTARAAN